MGQDTDFDWDEFRRLIVEYEALLERAEALERQEFDLHVLAALSRLYSFGASMPTPDEVYVHTGGDDVRDASESNAGQSEAEWSRAVSEWSNQLSKVLGELDLYSEVYDPSDGEVVVGSISDDLSDVLIDLRSGSALWDSEQQREAMWEWSFGFSHWGEHALSAMRAIHMRMER